MTNKESRHRPYRLTLIGLCCLVPVAALYGRYLERTYPWLIVVIPFGGFLLFLLHATSLAQRTLRAKAPPEKRLLKNLTAAALVAMPLLALCLSSSMVELSIERIHIVKYGWLSYLVVFAQSKEDFKRRVIIGLLLGALIGVGEETAQLWIVDRRFDPRDVMLNILSTALGVLYAQLVELSRRIRLANS